MNSIPAPRAFLATGFALVAAAMTGCASLPGTRIAMGAGPAVVAPARLSAAERDFLIKSAAKGMYEVEVSRLAANRAVSPAVRAFALMMVRHHTQANNELVSLMSAKGVAPPRGLAADKANKLHRLASLPASAAFDHGYVRVVGIEDHKATIAALERARRDFRDRDLKDWIERSLFTMRSHLSAAQSLAGTLEG